MEFPPQLGVPSQPLTPQLEQQVGRSLSRPADVHVRHYWPPNFTPPATGYWVMIQPWEFGSLPKSWIEPMARQVDEIWAYTHYVRQCYIDGGVPAEQVHVVPLGIDPERFHPQANPLPLETTKRFKFLFVGGTIFRKGIDLLLDAYSQAFNDRDDVCMVIKDMGVGSFYSGQTAEEQIARHRARPQAPAIEYLNRPLTEEELAGLYTACDCLVHPYRGEGFGLPIVEAMASGLPVVVTGTGAALDYCQDEHAFLIPARVVHLSEKRVGDLETVDYPWLAEPNVAALKELLRQIVEEPSAARAKGRRASAYIREHFTWERSADLLEGRLRALRGRPIRRFARPGVAKAPTPSAAPGRQPKVSLCMIVRNEEDNLAACIGPVADLVEDIVVVDTGSTDRTKEVATKLGVRVFDFPWVDSFAAARNESLKHAKGKWVFWLDADDRLDAGNHDKLRALFAGLKDENAAFVMKCLCLPDAETGSETEVDHVRLFRNHPQLRWKYRVHEQIIPGLRQIGSEMRWANIVIHHVGYQDPALRARKLQRDLRLLQMDNAEQPDDPFTLFNLGSVFLELERPAEALPLLKRSLERSLTGDSIVRKLYALIAVCQRRLHQTNEALQVCQDGRWHYPDDVELLFQEGMARRELGDLAGAEASYQRCLQTRESHHFASVDTGLRGYKARHNLAVMYRQQGRVAEAEAQWRAAVAEQPGFAPGWSSLAELYLSHRRWPDLEQASHHLENGADRPVEGTCWRARGHLARREFAPARRLLEETIARAPRAVGPRRFLTYALLQEGRDWFAAEQALRELLTLDPKDAEARHNLAVLLRQQQLAVAV